MTDEQVRQLVHGGSKLKVGDWVRIKKFIEVDDPSIGPGYVDEMREFANETTWIKEIFPHTGHITLSIDDGEYEWHEDWLELTPIVLK